MSIEKVATNHDGRVIAAVVNRYEPERDGLAAISCILYWDRCTGQRSEVVEGNYDILRRGELKLSANGRYVFHGERVLARTEDLGEPSWLRSRKFDRDSPE